MTEHGMRDPVFISQRKNKEDKVILMQSNLKKMFAKNYKLSNKKNNILNNIFMFDTSSLS